MLYPMAAMVLLTFIVMLINLIWRIQSVRRREVPIQYFKSFQGAAPEKLQAGTRHMANLFEVPVLFYVVCVTSMVVKLQTPLMVALAWSFVGLRALQAIIHMTYNKVLHRMLVFLCGFGVVLAMWLVVIIAYPRA